MDRTTIGSIISSLRYEKGYAKRQLCQGLCSLTMFGLIEEDKTETDKFLLDMLLQRLGKSPDKLEVILSDDEYERIRTRDYIEELIWKQEKEQAVAFLEKYAKRYAKDSNVQRMFVLRSKAYISYRQEHDIELAEHYIRKAIKMTLPEISSQNMKNYLLAGSEMENILALVGCLLEQDKDVEAKDWLMACRMYIERNVTDGEEYSKIHSKISWIQAKLYIKEEEYLQAFQLCEDALYNLRKYGILYFMIPLLEQMLFCGEKIGIDINKSKWKIYYDILVDLYQDYGEPWYCHDSLFHNCHQTVYHLASEFIRQERQNRSLTQEELIEGVYMSPETLSRVERGEVTPTKSKFEGLMNKLGIERGKYCGTAVVEHYEILEWKYEIDILVGRGKYEKAQESLDSLRKKLDCDKKINRMAIETYQNIIDVRQGKIDVKESCEKLMNLLKNCTYFEDGEICRVPFYNEVLVYNTICLNLEEMGNGQKGVEIYKKIIRAVEKSKVDEKYQNNILSVALANINYLDSNENWCEKGVAYELACGKGNMLSMHFMSQISLAKDENTRREVTRLAYYLADLFFREANKNNIKQYYEQTYKEQLL